MVKIIKDHMNDEMEMNRPENAPHDKKRRKRVNKWGVYLSLILIVIGLIWYGVNVGIIPFTFIQQQAGPIILVLIGLLILIRSL